MKANEPILLNNFNLPNDIFDTVLQEANPQSHCFKLYGTEYKSNKSKSS